jgi:glycosyltransferase involved in cell wall biosynthesis
MRILVVSLLYPIPENLSRGIFIADRVSLLRKMGHEVRVVNPLPRMLRINEARRSTLKGVASCPKYTPDENEGAVFHPKFTQLPDQNMLRWTISSLRGLAKKVEKWLGDWRPEIISCHTIWPVAELADVLAKRWNVAWSATVHGWDFDIGLASPAGKHICRLAGSATRLVAVTPRLAKLASHSEISLGTDTDTDTDTDTADDCTVIACHTSVGVDWRQPLRQYRGHWRRGRMEVLFPANPRRPEKRHMLALKACAELETRGWNVHMGGLVNVPRDMVFDRMVTCDIALITSSREAGPLVAREAIACGLPVAAVDVGDLTTWLPEQCIAKTATPSEIADAIEATLGDPLDDLIFPTRFGEEAVGRALDEMFTQIQN